jgi:hypothetical protein
LKFKFPIKRNDFLSRKPKTAGFNFFFKYLNLDLESLNEMHDQMNELRTKIEAEHYTIDLSMVFSGIEYYRFLIECLPPGSIPDVPFMSALLQIEAPIISKAAFLLETAYFVNRCNRKDWPKWIKMNIGSNRQFGSYGKSQPNTVKRNKLYQLAAANIFFAWAEVLGNKLAQILKNEEESLDVEQIVTSQLSPQDYYDEEMVNPRGNSCPFALKNIVCILLLEITMFLRETYQYMPKKVMNTSQTSNMNSNKSNIPMGQGVNPRRGANIGSVFSNESSGGG